MLLCNVVAVSVTSAQQQVFSGSEFYFHYKSQLYRNENSSIVGLEEANLSLPVGGAPQVVEVAAAIRNATTFFGTIWVGSVAWITQPFADPAVVNGELAFTVWLSSNDSMPSYSGVGAGVAVIDGKGRQVGNYAYAYSYAQGSVLSSTPKEYTFRVNFNQEVMPGEKLVFAVGLGSTTVYWRMQVYYDSTDYPSRAQLPTTVTVIPEFLASNAALTTFVVIALSLTLLRRYPIHYKIHEHGHPNRA
jgi:hypothetical protein